MSDTRPCPPKDALVTALYGEATAAERQALDRHLAACEACREEFESLGALRLALQEWDAPAPATRLLVVSETAPARAPEAEAGTVVAGPPRWWSSRGLYGAGLAAAATLVLGLAAGLANLDVTIGQGGITVRTGRGHAAAVTAERSPGGAPAVLPATTPATETALPATTTAVAPARAETPQADAPAGGDQAWRTELAALEQRMISEMESRLQSSARAPQAVLAGGRAADEAWFSRVQALIDASETRQQRNLAQRVTELAREFDVQRRTDLVSIQQGLGQLEGRTQAEVARTREMMNLLVRTSGGTPPR